MGLGGRGDGVGEGGMGWRRGEAMGRLSGKEERLN